MQGNVFVGFFNFVFIIGIDIKCFPVKVINVLIMLLAMFFNEIPFPKGISQKICLLFQIFFRTNLGSSCEKFFEQAYCT